MSTLRLVNETQAAAVAPIPSHASFATDRPPGAVVGADGVHGVDVEGVIGVDHGALRIRPLVQPGWGRSAATWGPYDTRCGLTASLLVLNGHNASENIEPWPSLARFLVQWSRGTQVDAVLPRLRARRAYGGRDTLRRRLRTLRHNHRAVQRGETQAENLAAGFFGAAAPADAAAGGPAFVIRSTGPTNGSLLAGQAAPRPVLESVQNVPLHLVVIAREEGALYAAGSLPGAAGLAATPRVRPLLIDPTPLPDTVWVGVHQAVLGQVGWGVDTRVEDVRVARPAALSTWYTTAHAADRLGGDPAGAPSLHRDAEVGGRWRPVPLGAGRVAQVVDPGAPSGLLHARLQLLQAEQRAGLALRVGTAEQAGPDGWVVTVSGSGVAAERLAGGDVVQRHQAPVSVAVAREVSLQILDDGERLTVLLDGEAVLGPFPAGDTPGTGVGVRCLGEDEGGVLHSFEAHPAELVLPAELCPPPPVLPRGERLVYEDDFRVLHDDPPAVRPPTADGQRPAVALGRRPVGPTRWEHTVGSTPFVLDGHGALVRPVPPPPGGIGGKLAALVRAEEHRNTYTLPWPDPAMADATVSLIAPGSGPGQGERGRGGIVFRQDRDHQLIVNTWIDDEYGGTSVSSFLRIGGFEDVYDAVWTNVGRRITWGEPYDLRVAFDGNCFVVSVDDEPILYRRITDIVPSARPLRIERVGIVSNWEFGDDTGTRFLRFRAAMGPRP